MDAIEQVTRETHTKMMGIDLKYLVKTLHYHWQSAIRDEDHANTWRFQLEHDTAKKILEQFCTIFPEHAPNLE